MGYSFSPSRNVALVKRGLTPFSRVYEGSALGGHWFQIRFYRWGHGFYTAMRGEFYNPSKTIKRNLLLSSLTQALLLVVVQTFIIHVPITIIALGGSTALAGLGVASMWGGRLVTTYQMGRLMDRVGRMPVIMAGLLLMAVTAVVAGLSVIWTLLTPYLFMIVLFGVGRGMADYIRIAAGDILPKERRGFGTGILLTGSLAGTLLATPVIAMVYNIAGWGEPGCYVFLHYSVCCSWVFRSLIGQT